MADHNREYRSLLELIADHGAAQAAQMAEDNGGKVPEDGFWRVEPPTADQRPPGTAVKVFTPTGAVCRSRIPVKGCTAETVRILVQSVTGKGFDIEAAKAEQKLRIQAASKAQAEQVAAAERELHARQRAAISGKEPPKRKTRKKWPTEHIVRCDIDMLQALNLLDEPGNGEHTPRPLSRSNIDRFKRIITGGRWIADYMHVDWYGQVVNGRQRLTAIAELEDWTVPCAIIYGVDPAIFAVMDTARRRTGGDMLYSSRLASKEDHVRMSSSLKLLHDCKSGKPLESWGREQVDPDMVIGLAVQYPDISQAMVMAHVLHTGRQVGVAKFMPSASIAFCYLAAEAWPGCGATLDQYILGVTRGEDVSKADPRKRLYNLMMSEAGGMRRGGGEAKSAQIRQLMLLLKYWNYFCKGVSMDKKAAAWRADEGVPIPVTESEVLLIG